MFVYSTIVFHANLQYAEIPKNEIHQVVHKSYIPVLKTLLNLPKCACVFNFTGYTLEILQDEYPSVIELVKQGIAEEKFELTGCGYTHPIFPLIPVEHKRKQLEFNQREIEKILNYSPRGFWLPELAYDPTLPSVLKEKGFEYIFIDEELYTQSSPLLNVANPFNSRIRNASEYIVEFLSIKGPIKRALKYMKVLKTIKKLCLNADFYPVEIKGAMGTITALKISSAWNIFTSAVLSKQPLLSMKEFTRVVKKLANNNKGLIIPYGTDLEFFGYRTLVDGSTISEKRLEYFLRKLISIEGNSMILPTNYLKMNKPVEIGYLKTGSWSPDKSFDLWRKEEDNRVLERLLDEIQLYLTQLPPDQLDDEIWKNILMAENSDGRGWDPIAERRLDCFAHALVALKLLKEKLLKTK